MYTMFDQFSNRLILLEEFCSLMNLEIINKFVAVLRAFLLVIYFL